VAAALDEREQHVESLLRERDFGAVAEEHALDGVEAEAAELVGSRWRRHRAACGGLRTI
jgi:hypothetical protein